MTRPQLKLAVAGEKSKASDYNDNFDLIMDYFEDTLDDTVSTFVNINTLASSGTIALSDNSINKISASGAVTFELPTVNNTEFHQILVQLYMSSARTIDLGTNYYFNQATPNMTTAGHYNIIYEYDCNESKWYVGAIYKGQVE